MATPLTILDKHDEAYGIRREVRARAERVDALGVDRSRFTNMPLPRWGVEAEARELILQAERAELTEADRWRARRELFKLTLRPREGSRG